MPSRNPSPFPLRNTVQLSAANIEAHYDQGNDMFRTFMDETMMYSSAIHWDNDAEEQEWLWGSKRDAELRTDEVHVRDG